MIASLKPYPSYKDSGVPWLGKVPAQWEIVRLKRIARLAYGDSLTANERQESEIPVYGSNGLVGYHNRANTLAPVIIVGRKGSFGKIQYSTKPVFAIDTTFFIDKHYTKANIKWLLYTLSQLELDRFSQDSAVPGLDREEAYKKLTVLPPLPEQRAIVKFLDWVERRIRFIVAARKRRIQLLEEYRQALINDAVTGKFDVRTGKSYPSYKDSGAPWLGKVPEHWHLVTLKRLAKSYRNGTTPPTAQSEYYASGEVPWYGPSSCESNEIVSAPIRYISNIALEDGVVKLVRGPALLIVVIGATAGKMALMPHDGTTNQQITAFELPYNLRASLFIVRQLRSSEEWLRGTASTATIPILKTSIVTHLHCAIPPEEEMHAIADYLDREAEKIDAAIEKTKESIALWEELRETLISDVVTGKLDVREAAERLPEEEPELEERVKAVEGLLLGGENETSGADSEPELAPAEETA